MTFPLPIRLDPNSAPDDTLHVTASGLPVRIYNINGGGQYPIHGAIYIGDGEWLASVWNADGFYTGQTDPYEYDLRDRPKQGVWVAWFKHEKSGAHHAVARASKEEATVTRYGFRLKGVHYIEEGDGLKGEGE